MVSCFNPAQISLLLCRALKKKYLLETDNCKLLLVVSHLMHQKYLGSGGHKKKCFKKISRRVVTLMEAYYVQILPGSFEKQWLSSRVTDTNRALVGCIVDTSFRAYWAVCHHWHLPNPRKASKDFCLEVCKEQISKQFFYGLFNFFYFFEKHMSTGLNDS